MIVEISTHFMPFSKYISGQNSLTVLINNKTSHWFGVDYELNIPLVFIARTWHPDIVYVDSLMLYWLSIHFSLNTPLLSNHTFRFFQALWKLIFFSSLLCHLFFFFRSSSLLLISTPWFKVNGMAWRKHSQFLLTSM